ncbi:uncharacterized protein SPSK_01544 [Sporothrix schenckii 1099-18]|uniref:MARVEL domain-containing protein n=1 Tax=Sporothrix schenckii 1099-18 TaxID=1397361 RepID=A0A0F2MEB7_SPOSC|nr:uncharacterized protein SPSK_01544 [Sporothrix schenckii 1099-18]KJR87205.1 hypothetical protein SPSK_01544 [Sporothrix schenckii 1099-18]
MTLRDHGYYGYAFVGARPCQIAALAALVGLAGHFVAQDMHAHLAVPGAVTGTIVTASLALLWTLVSATAYDDAHMPYLVTTSLDVLFLIPLVVVGVVLGRPLAGFSCAVLAMPSPDNANDLLAISLTPSSPASSYILFVGDNQTTCYEIKAAWGLVLALCVLFAMTSLVTVLQFSGKRRARQAQQNATRPAATAMAPAARIALPPSAVAFRPAEQIELSQSKTWALDDDDDHDDDEFDDNFEDHSSVHGSLHSLNSLHSNFYSQDNGTAAFPAAAPAFPSAYGRSLHPGLSAAVPLGIGRSITDISYSSRGRGASRLQRKRVPPRIKTARPLFEEREGEADGEDKDKEKEDMYDSGLTTPLSPPPQTHQTKTGPSASGSGHGHGNGSGRSSAASSRYAPRTPTPLSPVFLFASPTASPALMSSTPSPPRSSPPSPFPLPRNTAVAPGPPAVMPIPGAAAAAPTKAAARRPIPSRSLTQKYTPTHIAHYNPANPSKYTLPLASTTTPPSTAAAAAAAAAAPSRFARETLWPRVFQRSPVRRQQATALVSPASPASLSPISPILPPPQPRQPAATDHGTLSASASSHAHRKTLLERIEGWWDLGLLRGVGTIKSRRAPPKLQTTTTTTALPALSTFSSLSPFSSRTGRSAEMDVPGPSPETFV